MNNLHVNNLQIWCLWGYGHLLSFLGLLFYKNRWLSSRVSQSVAYVLIKFWKKRQSRKFSMCSRWIQRILWPCLAFVLVFAQFFSYKSRLCIWINDRRQNVWVHIKNIYNTTDHTERKRYCHVNKHLENGSLWQSFVFLLALSSKTSLKIVFTYSCYISCFNDFFPSRHNSLSGVILRSSLTGPCDLSKTNPPT